MNNKTPHRVGNPADLDALPRSGHRPVGVSIAQDPVGTGGTQEMLEREGFGAMLVGWTAGGAPVGGDREGLGKQSLFFLAHHWLWAGVSEPARPCKAAGRGWGGGRVGENPEPCPRGNLPHPRHLR